MRAEAPATSQVVDSVVALLFLFPEGKVLLEELNDALGIAEIIFFQLINLIKGFLQGAVGKFAGL